jgi:hypothetical protein
MTGIFLNENIFSHGFLPWLFYFRGSFQAGRAGFAVYKSSITGDVTIYKQYIRYEYDG